MNPQKKKKKKSHTHAQAHTHLYSVFLFLVRVSGISSPFFIQKLSSMVRWVLVRLHCSVSEPSTGSVACSEGLIDGSVKEGGGHGSASAEATTLAALVGGSLLEGVNNQPGRGEGSGGVGRGSDRNFHPHFVLKGKRNEVAVWEELFRAHRLDFLFALRVKAGPDSRLGWM